MKTGWDLGPFWKSRTFVAGVALLVFGSGPLFLVILLAWLGITADPNPNPVGFGILAMFTFWPGIILTVVGFVASIRKRRNSVEVLPPRLFAEDGKRDQQ